jgi:hypothetical protein
MSLGYGRLCVLAGLLASLGVFSLAVAADVLSDLGVAEDIAKDKFFYTFTTGSASFPTGGAVKDKKGQTPVGESRNPTGVFLAATGESRALMVKAVFALARVYTQSDEFTRRYAEFRRANRPAAPEAQPGSAEARKEIEKAIKQAEAEMKTLPPEMQKQFQASIAEMKASMDPHAKELKEFEARYPEDPSALVANRLKEFLTLTAGIDYNARLVSEGGKQRFADRTLEGKPADWKFCFRAGREATEAARASATQWLKELGR